MWCSQPVHTEIIQCFVLFCLWVKRKEEKRKEERKNEEVKEENEQEGEEGSHSWKSVFVSYFSIC